MTDKKKTPARKAKPAKSAPGAKRAAAAEAGSDTTDKSPAADKSPPKARKAMPKPPAEPPALSESAPPEPQARTRGVPLGATAFRATSRAGLGAPGERLFSGLAWFNGALYLATSARAPEGMARIHRRLPSGDWAMVHESPPQPLGDGTRMSREYAITALAVLQAPDDAGPCLYAGTASILGGQILRSEDGETFSRVSPHGLDDDTRLSVTQLTVFAGRLFAIPRGTITDAVHEPRWSPEPVIHVALPPEAGAEPRWAPACLPGFGDLTNLEIATLTVAHGYLYAATINPTHGFQLWRTKAEGLPPFAWEQVLTRGAWRHSLNMEVTAAVEFDGALWLGTGLPGRGHDVTHDVGPGAAELIRVAADGSWDIVTGEMRFTPDGLKVPQTTMGPGFHNDFNAAISALCVHDGVLYAGTANWEPRHITDLPVEEGARPPELEGGAELWHSSDGTDWTRIAEGPAADPAAVRIGHLAAAPGGAGLALTLDLSGKAVARKANLWVTGLGMLDVPPDDEAEVILGGVAPEAPPAPLSLDADPASSE